MSTENLSSYDSHLTSYQLSPGNHCPPKVGETSTYGYYVMERIDLAGGYHSVPFKLTYNSFHIYGDS